MNKISSEDSQFKSNILISENVQHKYEAVELYNNMRNSE